MHTINYVNSEFEINNNNKSIKIKSNQFEINGTPGTENQVLSVDASSNMIWKTIPASNIEYGRTPVRVRDSSSGQQLMGDIVYYSGTINFANSYTTLPTVTLTSENMSTVFITNLTTTSFSWKSNTDVLPFGIESQSTITGYLHWTSIGTR
jgi:hypothetical protein